MQTSSPLRALLASDWAPLLLASLLGAVPLPSKAAEGSLLELYLGPHETDWLELRTLRVQLDGADLPVTPPAKGADPAEPVYSAPVAPGPHELKVEAGLEGDSRIFTYVDRYLFTMRGQLGFEAPAGELVAVQAQVTANGAFTVRWTDRYRLTLRATHYRSERAAAAQVPAAARPPEPTPAPAPIAAAPPRPARASSCTLGPVRFAFDRSDLGEQARAALDQYADCLAGTEGAVEVVGHTDPQGPAAYNERLGERRARAAAAYLVARGVPASRLTVRSMGERQLLCTVGGPACNAQNRRVEITAIP